MYTKDTEGYQAPSDFAKTHTHTVQWSKKRVGVSRKYIYDLIEREKLLPGSTDIDVFEIGGRAFVRSKKKQPIASIKQSFT